jgi:hypothetical protein
MSEPLAATQTTTSTPAGAPRPGGAAAGATKGQALKATSLAAPHGRASGTGQTSTAAIAVGAVVLVLLIAAALWALARSRVYDRPGLLSLRHAIAEAGYRMSATWSELADWARLGR